MKWTPRSCDVEFSYKTWGRNLVTVSLLFVSILNSQFFWLDHMAGTHHPSPFCLSGKAEKWGGVLLCFAASSLAHRDTEERGRVSYGAAYTFHLNSFIRILVTAILLVNFRFSIWFSVKPSVILVLPKCYLFSYLCCDLLHAPAPPDTDPTTNPQQKKRNMKIKLRSKKEKN